MSTFSYSFAAFKITADWLSCKQPVGPDTHGIYCYDITLTDYRKRLNTTYICSFLHQIGKIQGAFAWLTSVCQIPPKQHIYS